MKRKKLFSILIILTILASAFCPVDQVYAKEAVDISKYAKQTTDLSELVPESVNISANTSIEESTVPAFLLLITDGEDSYVTSAFYVEDTFGTGGTYLITSNLAFILMNEGFELHLIRGDYSAQVTNAYIDSSENLSFLIADGLDKYEPMQMTDDISGSRSAMGWLTVDENQNFYMEFEELDMSDWQEERGIYTNDGQIDDLVYFGAPVLDLNSMKVWGMMYATSEFQPVILDINYADFPEEAAIAGGTTTSASEEEPVSEEPEEYTTTTTKSNDMTKWIAIAAIVAIAVMYLKKKQKNPVQKATPEYREGTIPLYNDENPKTQAVQAENAGNPGKRYQIRGTNGVFKGQIFEVHGITATPFFYMGHEDKKDDLIAENLVLHTYKNCSAENFATDYGVYFEYIHDGWCGDNVYWSFDSDTNTLSLEGSGDTWVYAVAEEEMDMWCEEFPRKWVFAEMPDWTYSLAEDIENIVVGDGIGHLNATVFGRLEHGCHWCVLICTLYKSS